MQFELITPEKIYYSGDADMVIIPGQIGEFGVMKDHAPFVSTLRPGIVTIEQSDGSKRQVVVLSGIAEVSAERCTLLAEEAQDCDGITMAAAQEKLSAAQKAVDNAVTDAEKKSADHARAIAQAMVASL